ncbi:MAG: tetratricopeptide repeat protein, partial [Acidobacteriota bacterium]
MKRCPVCRRDYYDDTLRYCLDDGNALLEGPASFSANDEPATAILPAFDTSEHGTAIFGGAAVTQAAAKNSIAVLPFANMSADEENEYFCEGMAEELLNALSKIDDLKVAARTSAFSFKGKNTNVSEIGEKLSVKNVLQGSVRRAGNRLRISVQLVNAADGFHLWSERYDREMQDIFELQDEITLSVVDALKVKLLGEEIEVVLKRYTHNAEAYELFLKGRFYHYKYTAEGWKRAIEFFAKAIEIEPNYAPAYAAMTSSWGCLWFFGLVSAEQAIPSMKAATVKSLEIDENLAESHLSQAMVSFFYEWEWQKAEREFKRAITIDPNNVEALSFYAMFLAFEERFNEALDQNTLSLAIDPLSLLINMNAGWTYFTAGLPDQALDQVGKMIELKPDFYGAYWLKGAICLTEGNYDEAIVELKKGVSLGGHHTVLADLGSAYGLAGRKDEAADILTQLLEMRRQEYVSAICIARVYSRIGENDKAIEWLEKAVEERNGEMLFLKGEIDGAP